MLLMAEIPHQSRLVVYPITYRGLYMPGGAGFFSINSKDNKGESFQIFQYQTIAVAWNILQPRHLTNICHLQDGAQKPVVNGMK